MKPPSNEAVTTLLQDIAVKSSGNYQIVTTIRALFLEQDAAIEEGVKYGGLVFFRAGNLIGGIFVYSEHITIEFSHGASYDDPAALLLGKGKSRRHLKITAMADIEALNVASYVQQAIQHG